MLSLGCVTAATLETTLMLHNDIKIERYEDSKGPKIGITDLPKGNHECRSKSLANSYYHADRQAYSKRSVKNAEGQICLLESCVKDDGIHVVTLKPLLLGLNPEQ